jgi:4-oxalocrotonate tautomerase
MVAAVLARFRIAASGMQKEKRMSLIQVRVAENTFTPAQKRQIINKLTDAVLPIEGENTRRATVVIEEVRSGDWNTDGHAKATETMHAACASFLGFGCI